MPGLRPDLYPFVGTPRVTITGDTILTERAGRIEGGTTVFKELDALTLEPTGNEFVAGRLMRVVPYLEAKAYADENHVSLAVAASRFALDEGS